MMEQALSPIQRGFFSRRRRTDIPQLPPGAVYVFQVGGRCSVYPEGTAFDPTYAEAVDATSVSLVDMRARLVEAERIIPSVSEADAFTVRATFTCQVTDAATVARQGVIDATVPLRAYLSGEDQLARASAAHRIEEVNAVRELVTHRMNAYTTIVPPRIAGMSVEYVGIEVLTPEDLRTWEQEVRDERRMREMVRGQREFETDDVHRIAELLSQGSHYVDAFGVAREDINIHAIAARIHQADADDKAYGRQVAAHDKQRAHERETAERNMRQALLLAVLDHARESGYVDHQLLQQLLDLGNRAGPNASQAAGALPHAGAAPRPANDGPHDDHRGFIKDEDDLLD
ncbi:hypothetical protein ADK86_05510 [Streptomyces sp. NRRL F-5755]|uniref:hypothetical protein n=1 Tax=Streptomyces sp. NRRL F-5755 TaxID=1519475 RepID=UPI0006C22565|nr:hypothetical protein [Streptomyces sp. NRRL F-5755]KOU07067.1 hypothetical protein ADK86_05510 [Streptomyces sp. NRRL F-5755]